MGLVSLSLGIYLSTAPAAAEETRKLDFSGPRDHFELILKGGAGRVDGKPADLGAARDLLPVLTDEILNPCATPPKGRPDLTVREGARQRRVFIDQGVIQDGDACVSVGGTGLAFAPTHRDFLIGPKQDALDLKGDVELLRDGTKLLTLHAHGDGWAATDPRRLVSRDFFERFAASLTSFTIRSRAALSFGKGKPRLTVRNAGRTFDFFRLPNSAWGLKKPGAAYLILSDDWGFFENFNDETFADPYAAAIGTAGDTTRATEERRQALAGLGGAWSPNLRALYHGLLREDPGVEDFKLTALQRLKRKPSLETAGVMIDLLAADASDAVKRDAAIILKLQNPKGPKYTPRASAAERAKTIAFWRQWWTEQRP